MKVLAVAFIMALLFSVLAGTVHFGIVQASTDVSGIPKPSVPEFTLKFVDHSYDVPPTYSIDPYTGKNVMTQAGYHVENKSIEVTIKNQPFTSYRNENDSLVGLFYNIRVKGHFEDWHGEPSSEHYIYRSDSDYTVVAYGLGGNNGSDYYSRRLEEISAGGQVDFQVEALIGYYTRVYGTPVPGIPGSGTSYHDVFTGETSGWSNTQTVTIGESQPPTSSPATTPTPTPHQEPQQTEQEIIIGAAIAAAVIVAGVGLLIYLIKRK